jgi:hypothetical protein
MSKELDLAVTVIAYVELTKLTAKIIEQERVKVAWKQRTEEDKRNFAEVMDSIVPTGQKLLDNMKKLSEEDE